MRNMAAKTNKIYIFELFASAAPVFQLREELRGRKVILFVDNEAACAALANGAAKSQVALMLVFALSEMAAQRDISIWTERVPTQVNPPYLPPRNREISFRTGSRQEVAPVDVLVSIPEIPWAFQRTK